MLAFMRNGLNKTIEISEPQDGAALAKRWVVERTLASLNHYPRLSKAYEMALAAAENRVMIAHSMAC